MNWEGESEEGRGEKEEREELIGKGKVKGRDGRMREGRREKSGRLERARGGERKKGGRWGRKSMKGKRNGRRGMGKMGGGTKHRNAEGG